MKEKKKKTKKPGKIFRTKKKTLIETKYNIKTLKDIIDEDPPDIEEEEDDESKEICDICGLPFYGMPCIETSIGFEESYNDEAITIRSYHFNSFHRNCILENKLDFLSMLMKHMDYIINVFCKSIDNYFKNENIESIIANPEFNSFKDKNDIRCSVWETKYYFHLSLDCILNAFRIETDYYGNKNEVWGESKEFLICCNNCRLKLEDYLNDLIDNEDSIMREGFYAKVHDIVSKIGFDLGREEENHCIKRSSFMEINNVTGSLVYLKQKKNKFVLKIRIGGLKEIKNRLISLKHFVKLYYCTDSNSMEPAGNYAQKCMELLEEFDEESILKEKNQNIREMYFVGRVINQISCDLLSNTHLLKLYEYRDILEDARNEEEED